MYMVQLFAGVVFPACAGVIRAPVLRNEIERGFPRMRGGDPFITFTLYHFTVFSPHARG